MSTNEAFTPQVRFICPFCGLLCEAGAAEGEVAGVFHEMPTCSRFDSIDDPSDFMAACRAEFAKTAHS